MSTELQLEQMSVAEKLSLMEQLWEDLRARAGGVPMPQWHKDLLEDRERLIQNGDAHFDDWPSAKKRITEETS
jgi:Putative addiction module component